MRETLAWMVFPAERQLPEGTATRFSICFLSHQRFSGEGGYQPHSMNSVYYSPYKNLVKSAATPIIFEVQPRKPILSKHRWTIVFIVDINLLRVFSAPFLYFFVIAREENLGHAVSFAAIFQNIGTRVVGILETFLLGNILFLLF